MDLIHRPRRLRRTPAVRSLVRETRLTASQLIEPIFVHDGTDEEQPIGSLPGISRWSVQGAVKQAQDMVKAGIGGILLFGIPAEKDERGSQGDDPNGVVQRAVREIRKAVGDDLVVITDVCLCEYTSHGHCGIMHEGEVVNDATVERLQRIALSHAEAGAHWVAPSDMMDGRVGAIRETLDDAGYQAVSILSYSVKYASAFYGPFREAAQSTPSSGDRRGAQMDPGNAREALKEAALDLDEGADMLMVKPALAYLDIIRELRENFDVPIAAYHVSGEYAMVKAAAEKGWIDGDAVMEESLISIARAGADMIISYAARQVAKRLARA